MGLENYSSLYDLFPWIIYDDDPISVLIVEDDAVMSAQFKSLVRALDYEVSIDSVTKAEDAKRLIEGENFEHYDLIISDQFLEGTETGLDLWRYCRQYHPDIRFILTSGEQLKDYIERLTPTIEKPEFLPKPFSVKQAMKKIENSLTEADHTKIVTNIKGRDSVKVTVPYENRVTLPVGNQTIWNSHMILALIFSFYIAVVYTHLGRMWGEDYQPLNQMAHEEEKASPSEKELKSFVEFLPIFEKTEPMKVPGFYNPRKNSEE